MSKDGAGPDLEGLARFVGRKDRGRPAHFAGRADFVAEVASTLRMVMVAEGVPDDEAPGLTLLFQGAPGAGKTALLRELARRFRADAAAQADASSAGVPVPLVVARDLLYSEEAVVLAIAEAMDDAGTPGWNVKPVDFRRTASHDVSGGVKIVGLSAGGRRGGSQAPEPATFNVLRRLQPPHTWTRPVCLLVDEVQGLEPGARDVLNKLHNHMQGLPVLTVLAGLGDSSALFSEEKGKVGISRFGLESVRDMPGLSPEEGMSSVLGMLEVFRVDLRGADPEDWASALVELSDSWPQHLHNGQRALAKDLLRTRGRLAEADWNRVLKQQWEWRETAYGDRVSTEMHDARCLVGAVMAALPPEGLRSGQVIDAIRQTVRGHTAGDVPPPQEWDLPEGMTAADFRSHLVHRGALHFEPKTNLYYCPIPSFRDYLVAKGMDGPQAAPEEPQQDDGLSGGPS